MLFATGRQSLLSISPRMGTSMIRTMASLPHRRWQANKKKLRSAEVQFQNRMTTPDHSLAMAMPTNVREMDNQTLITLAALNDHAACSEMLIRHIMTADRFSYDMALEKYQEIDTFHKQGMMMYLFPFQIGIVTSLTAAVASGPLCFHLPSVHLFNHHFVTTSVPEPEDLETWLEVGSWAWNWMEPPLGQISFFLLCLQFSRYVWPWDSTGTCAVKFFRFSPRFLVTVRSANKQGTTEQFRHSTLHTLRETSSNQSTSKAVPSLWWADYGVLQQDG